MIFLDTAQLTGLYVLIKEREYSAIHRQVGLLSSNPPL